MLHNNAPAHKTLAANVLRAVDSRDCCTHVNEHCHGKHFKGDNELETVTEE